MSSEVCPHCGKTYKRLKSHLPYCKAAASSKTPGATQDVPTSPTLRSAAALPKTTRGQKVKPTSSLTSDLQEVEKVKKAVASLSSPSFSITSPPSSAKKKKKQKVADQVKATSVFSSSSPPLPPTFSKPKKKSLRASVEAAMSEPITQESLKETTESSLNGCSRDQKGTKVYPDKDSVNDQRLTAKKVVLDPNVKDNSTKPRSGHSFCVDTQVETEESSTQKLFLKSGSGHQVKVTLQDVKATLGRANAHRHSGRPSVLSRIAAADNQSHEIQLSSDNEPHRTELQLFHRKCKQLALIPLPQDAACQQEPGAPAAFALTASASQVQQATPPPATLPEASQLEVGKQTTEGPLRQQSLGQVRLKELPTWLASRAPRHPRDVVDMVQNGWQWYYRRYIDVKKGGVAGVSMLLVGYCVLSYIWSYPHIKLSRWRKYH